MVDRCARGMLFLLLCYVLTPGHPHMFIDVSMKCMLNDSGVEGVYVYWDMDEMNSAWIIEEQDRNRNGFFEKEEQRRIRTEAFSRAATQNYFMHVSWDSRSMDTVHVEKFTASIKHGITVVYSFFVSFNLCLREIADTEIRIFFEDPSMYIAFTLQKKLIQVSTNDNTEGSVTFRKVDYSDAIYLSIKAKH